MDDQAIRPFAPPAWDSSLDAPSRKAPAMATAIRVLGWLLLIVGFALLARTSYLVRTFFLNMGHDTRQFMFVMLLVSTGIALLGGWLLSRRRRPSPIVAGR